MQLSEPRWLDFAVLAYLALAAPLIGWWGYRRFCRWVEEGRPRARLVFYRGTAVLSWIEVGILVGLWLAADRDLAALGLGPGAGGWRLAAGWGATLIAVAVLAQQTITVPRNRSQRRDLLRRFAHVRGAMPHNGPELRSFAALSVTAGICEEVVYRGYAIWLLAALGGPWLAVGGSVALFSLGHLYQGARGVGGILLVGLATAGLYLLTGALWAPMLLHTAIDLSSGATFHALLAREAGSDGAA